MSPYNTVGDLFLDSSMGSHSTVGILFLDTP